MQRLNRETASAHNVKRKKSAANRVCPRTKNLVYVALLVALIAALSQISIPTPTGIPLTMQIFAIAFAAYFIGWKYGVLSVIIYIIIGAAGMPVFSNFTGGFGKLVSVTGGFIWGFIPMTFITGLISTDSFVNDDSGLIGRRNKAAIKTVSSAVLGLAGAVCCHFFGVLQYCLITGVDAARGILTVSLPFIAKDIVSVLLAYLLAKTVKSRLERKKYA